METRKRKKTVWFRKPSKHRGPKTALGEFLRGRRQELNLTQAEVGELIGSSAGTIWAIENNVNQKATKSTTLAALAGELNISLETLIDLDRKDSKGATSPSKAVTTKKVEAPRQGKKFSPAAAQALKEAVRSTSIWVDLSYAERENLDRVISEMEV